MYYWLWYMFVAGTAMRFQYYTIFALVESTRASPSPSCPLPVPSLPRP